jgi:hypothetical protein
LPSSSTSVTQIVWPFGCVCRAGRAPQQAMIDR